MNDDRPIKPDFSELWALMASQCDGTMTAADWDRLSRLLCDDAEARAIYVQHMDQHAALLWRYRDKRDEKIHAVDALDISPPQPSPSAPCFLTGIAGYLPENLPFAYFVSTAVLGIGAMIASFIYVSSPFKNAEQNTYFASGSATSISSQNIVGRITGTADCRWEKKGLGIRDQGLEGREERGEGRGKVQGSRSKVQNRKIAKFPNSNPQSLIPNPSLTTNHYPLTTPHKSLVSLGDQLILSAGLMEITYNTGAKVILQGPCTFDVDSADGGFLAIGKLTARVESGGEGRSKVQGPRFKAGKSPNPENPKSPNPTLTTNHYPLFTIKTPTATVTDLGTEFGVEVDKAGATSASVFQGAVEVRANGPEGLSQNAIRLLENESVTVEQVTPDENPVVRRIRKISAEFVRVGQLRKFAEESKLDPFRRWQTYSEQLRHDPSLLAYYDFQLTDGNTSVLRNVAANADRSTDGVVENATWVDGRFHGKHAILFNGPMDCVRVNLTEKTFDLSLMAWIYFNALEGDDHCLVSAILDSEGWANSGLVHWQIKNSDGHIGLSVFGAVGGDGNAISPPIVTADRFGRWMHLGCVFDRGARQVRFYLDGQEFGSAEYAVEQPICFGPARVGNWDSEPRTLYARIDELAIFKRPLGTKEVRELYEQGKP